MEAESGSESFNEWIDGMINPQDEIRWGSTRDPDSRYNLKSENTARKPVKEASTGRNIFHIKTNSISNKALEQESKRRTERNMRVYRSIDASMKKGVQSVPETSAKSIVVNQTGLPKASKKSHVLELKDKRALKMANLTFLTKGHLVIAT